MRIITMYRGATNRSGAKIFARDPASGRSKRFPFDCEYSHESNHRSAAVAFASWLMLGRTTLDRSTGHPNVNVTCVSVAERRYVWFAEEHRHEQGGGI